jgi:hypothetical protein
MKVVSEALTFFVSFFVLRQKMKSLHDSYRGGLRDTIMKKYNFQVEIAKESPSGIIIEPYALIRRN